MGLSLISIIAAIGLSIFAYLVGRRGQGSVAARLHVAIDLSLIVYSLSYGLASLIPPYCLFLSRMSFAALFIAEGLIFGYALEFPRRLHLAARIAASVVSLASIGAAVVVFINKNFLANVLWTQNGLRYTEGRLFPLFMDISTGVALLAVAAHIWRAIATDDRINKQRSALAAAGVLIGAASVWVIFRVAPSISGIRSAMNLAPIFIFVMSAISAYSFNVSRLFDWRENGWTILSYAILATLFGAPAGAAIAFLSRLGTVFRFIPIVVTPFVFIAAYRLAKSFAGRTLANLGSRGEYREELESALVHIDLAKGRDEVLAELYEVLSGHLGFADFAVLLEDDAGVLKCIFAPTGGDATLERGSALRNHLERTDEIVLMRSEVQASPAHEAVRTELLALLDALKAEVLILTREGRRVIGAFSLGAHKSGADYTDYDYDTFRAICGKLFVFAFYFKNIARESIVYTVDRELALSDQIIRFALEKVDKVNNPEVDVAWASRSTRRLGGDFVDFVRLSKERWFFVLGDVSGKGLSASMNMLVLKSMVRTFLRVEKDLTSLVQRVNLFIKEKLPKGSFFAGAFGYFDFEQRAIYFINCGVPAILLYAPAFDAFVEIQGEGKILGFVKDIKPYLKPRKMGLPHGAALVFTTDGIIDSENIRGERFGKDRLRKAARDRLDKSAKEIADGVIDDLLVFTDKRQEDDLTLLAMKFKERRA